MADLEISQYVISAICGNWWRESSVNPERFENDQPVDWHTLNRGYGLGQWTNTNGDVDGRLWQLHSWVTSNGYTDGDGDGQLAFLIEENYWTPKTASKYHYRNLTEFLTSTAQNLDYLVWDFLACWEGVTGDHYQERCTYARKAFLHIQQHKDDGITYNWISRAGQLSESEILNNVMVIYQRIGKWRPPKKDKMPLWMMLKKRNVWIPTYY